MMIGKGVVNNNLKLFCFLLLHFIRVFDIFQQFQDDMIKGIEYWSF